MVGVPGRSKGCNTCIHRKIRCDQETPLCGNCRKSNRLCTGYKRRLGYVLSRDVSLTDLPEPRREESTITFQEPTQIWTDYFSSRSLGHHQVSTNAMIREQLHYVYLDYNVPTEMLCSRPKSVVTRNWLLQLQDVVIESPALETSIAAFFAAQVGRKNSDMNLVHQSRSMYVSGLQRFQEALRNPRTRLSDETLAACMALSLYELTECPSGTRNAYMTHQAGAMKLLQLRGPDASASPLGQSLFLGLRTQTSALIGNPVDRGEAFLCSPEWIERPWKLVPKTPLDELIDLLFDFHAILQQFITVSNETHQSTLQVGLRDIIAQCLKVEAALRGLFWKFENSASGLLYWPELSTLESRADDTRLGKVFPVSFHFPAFFVAQFVTTYWAGMMAVHNLLMFTYDKLAKLESSTVLTCTTNGLPWLTSAGNTPSDVRSREHGYEWKNMVKNICQSVEYFLEDQRGTYGPLAILAQLRGCKRNLGNVPEGWSREISWITDFMERIQKKVDFPVSNLLGG